MSYSWQSGSGSRAGSREADPERPIADRIEALESVVLRGVALLAGFLLVVGQLAPYVRIDFHDEESLHTRLLTIGFQALADDGSDGFTWAIAVGYLGLTVVTVLAVVFALTTIWWRAATRPGARWPAICSVLLMIGTAIEWLLVAFGGEDWTLGSGNYIFTSGVLVMAVLVHSPALRELWVRRSEW